MVFVAYDELAGHGVNKCIVFNCIMLDNTVCFMGYKSSIARPTLQSRLTYFTAAKSRDHFGLVLCETPLRILLVPL